MQYSNDIDYAPPAATESVGVVEHKPVDLPLVGSVEKLELESLITALLSEHHSVRGEASLLSGDVALMVNEDGVSLQDDQQKIARATAAGVLSIVPMLSLPIARALTIMRGQHAAVPQDTLPRFAREAARKISADINALMA